MRLHIDELGTSKERQSTLFGESLGELADNLGAEEGQALVGDLKQGSISVAARKLVDNLGGDDLNWLVDELRPTVQISTPDMRESAPDAFVDFTSDQWDEEFAGQLMDQFRLLVWVLQMNYGSFFEGAGGLAGAARQFVTPTPSSSKPQPTPTSGSGASSSQNA